GIDIRDVKQGDLRSRLGMVMQESLFFAGSIKDNLLLARPDASEKDCWAALEAANAAGFVREFPGGLATELGERGARLSGGQKQRLAIARAFLKDPAILLLDEPTSALDAKSEQHVKEALNRLLKGRTSIIVAHRLSTVVDSDRIVVMEKGQILAVGNHESLQKECPLYAGLCRAQGLA
ncbi:MAG: ATP-binding cassette domain-containing protein, partial [Opitutales bacterium]|nr:ATP-binding cassette domain-containing protein [Opitutales bacterium]